MCVVVFAVPHPHVNNKVEKGAITPMDIMKSWENKI
jgi:hypothetical protein